MAVLAMTFLLGVGPCLIAGFLVPGRRRAGEWLALCAGCMIFLAAGAWRVAERTGWLPDDGGPGPDFFFIPGFVLAAIVALAALPIVDRWPSGLRLPRRLAAIVVIVSAIVLVSELRAPEGPAGHPGEQPNLLVVTIDTLRRDALGSYGGPHPTALDSIGGIAHEGWSVSSWTQPSMASLFSGTIPTGHGSDRQHSPDPAVSWWPEHIAVSGSRTAAIVTNPYLRRRFGFDRGFGSFDHAEERAWLEPVARTDIAEWVQAWLNARGDGDRADRVVGRAIRWLEGTSPDQPWFLWVHLLDPHLPYVLRGPDGSAGRVDAPDWMQPLDSLVGPEGFKALHELRDGSLVLDEEQQVGLRNLYQTEVEYAAWWTARLIRTAQRVTGDRELVWLVTSDHGEEFFDEGGFEHGHSLADAVLRVPLLASGIEEEPRTLRLIDIGPVVLGALGVGENFDPARGTGLLESDGQLRPYALPALPSDAACDRPVMLAEGLLYGPARTRLYLPDGRALERDDETGTIEALERCDEAVGIALEFDWRTLDLWRERRAVSPVSMEVDDDLRRQLRALGYVN